MQRSGISNFTWLRRCASIIALNSIHICFFPKLLKTPIWWWWRYWKSENQEETNWLEANLLDLWTFTKFYLLEKERNFFPLLLMFLMVCGIVQLGLLRHDYRIVDRALNHAANLSNCIEFVPKLYWNCRFNR